MSRCSGGRFWPFVSGAPIGFLATTQVPSRGGHRRHGRSELVWCGAGEGAVIALPAEARLALNSLPTLSLNDGVICHSVVEPLTRVAASSFSAWFQESPLTAPLAPGPPSLKRNVTFVALPEQSTYLMAAGWRARTRRGRRGNVGAPQSSEHRDKARQHTRQRAANEHPAGRNPSTLFRVSQRSLRA